MQSRWVPSLVASLPVARYAMGMLALLLVAVLGVRRAADEELVRRIAAGDATALRTLYERCAGTALAVARRVLRQQGEAEEIVQDAFVEVWRRAPSFDAARGSLTAWVVAICHSRAIDRLRARSSAERAALAASREEPEAPPLPLEGAEQRQDRERVRSALQGLPAEQRQVIELAYYEGLTQREIAERTGDPLGTVKTRARLALLKLADALSDGPAEEGGA